MGTFVAYWYVTFRATWKLSNEKVSCYVELYTRTHASGFDPKLVKEQLANALTKASPEIEKESISSAIISHIALTSENYMSATGERDMMVGDILQL